MNTTRPTKDPIIRGLIYVAIIIGLIEAFSTINFTGLKIKTESEKINLPTSEKKIGDCLFKISQENSEILIDNFPQYWIGGDGINSITWPRGFSFVELDKFTYNALISKKFSSADVKIFIRQFDEDRYGNINPSEWIFLGKINVDEAKKYRDFDHWNKQYNTIKTLFWSMERKNK